MSSVPQTIFLIRGMTSGACVPGASDIDFLVVSHPVAITEALRAQDRIARVVSLVKLLVPMLGHVWFVSPEQFRRFQELGSLRYRQAPSWRLLYGPDLRISMGVGPSELLERSVAHEFEDCCLLARRAMAGIETENIGYWLWLVHLRKAVIDALRLGRVAADSYRSLGPFSSGREEFVVQLTNSACELEVRALDLIRQLDAARFRRRFDGEELISISLFVDEVLAYVTRALDERSASEDDSSGAKQPVGQREIDRVCAMLGWPASGWESAGFLIMRRIAESVAVDARWSGWELLTHGLSLFAGEDRIVRLAAARAELGLDFPAGGDRQRLRNFIFESLAREAALL